MFIKLTIFEFLVKFQALFDFNDLYKREKYSFYTFSKPLTKLEIDICVIWLSHALLLKLNAYKDWTLYRRRTKNLFRHFRTTNNVLSSIVA